MSILHSLGYAQEWRKSTTVMVNSLLGIPQDLRGLFLSLKSLCHKRRERRKICDPDVDLWSQVPGQVVQKWTEDVSRWLRVRVLPVSVTGAIELLHRKNGWQLYQLPTSLTCLTAPTSLTCLTGQSLGPFKSLKNKPSVGGIDEIRTVKMLVVRNISQFANCLPFCLNPLHTIATKNNDHALHRSRL